MSGGGKGGSSSTSVKIPAFLEDAAKQNLAKANSLATIGATPYYGPDVAALTPAQLASMGIVNNAALSFGLQSAGNPMAGMPPPQVFDGGITGYGSSGIYDQARRELELRMPGQYAALNAPFINQVTGAPPLQPFGFGTGYNPTGAGSSGSSSAGYMPGERSSDSDRRADTSWGDAGSMTGGPSWGDIGGGLMDRVSDIPGNAFDRVFGDPFAGTR
jgi:hypothetical protein